MSDLALEDEPVVLPGRSDDPRSLESKIEGVLERARSPLTARDIARSLVLNIGDGVSTLMARSKS